MPSHLSPETIQSKTQPLDVYRLSPDQPHPRSSSHFPHALLHTVDTRTFFCWCILMDNLSGLGCLLSSNSSTHSLMCSSPSIDADTSILIIAHTRSTLFVLLFCLILSQPLVSLYISYLLTPHPPLIIPSCFTVLLLSLSPSLSPISLYKHLSPSQMILMLCSFASIHLFPMVHYIDIVPYFHPRCFSCPLFGNASTTRPPALAEFNCDSSGASRVLSTQ